MNWSSRRSRRTSSNLAPAWKVRSTLALPRPCLLCYQSVILYISPSSMMVMPFFSSLVVTVIFRSPTFVIAPVGRGLCGERSNLLVCRVLVGEGQHFCIIVADQYEVLDAHAAPALDIDAGLNAHYVAFFDGVFG